ncbi:hypothetical protein LZC95_43125 [Pendulispora brunnea]|uniref:Uncharacterized protein n=1 Tax=Pendulispora brunnea TaxID=2905690 RepID=A0ABZ2K8T4_9BACT
MVRWQAHLWGALLVCGAGVFALQCSLEGLGDGVRPSSPEAGDGAASHAEAGPWPDRAIVAGLSAPDHVAVGPDFLYFTTARAGGSVERCPIQGCAGEPELIRPGQKDPRGLGVAQDGTIGWVNFAGGQVTLATRSPGASVWQFNQLAAGQESPAGMAILAKDDAIWSNFAAATGSPGVVRRTLGNSIVLSRKALEPGPIVLPRGTHDVVWGDSHGLSETTIEGDGSDGNAACTFVTSEAGVQSLLYSITDPSQVYWSTFDGRLLAALRPPASYALQHCNEGPSDIVTLVSVQGQIVSMASSGSFIYFSANENGMGSLRVATRSSGQIRVLLDGLDDPRGVAMDESYVYVAVRGDGTIRRVLRIDV